ncbi:MAG: hypothetical protein PHR21_09135 [Oscillospiraceae bacterium]|nr:hypothetical protein [Oscillospiraceae bacterium]MDD4368614.1 hypothetical protein [Oscillospiraceae bacterium]
MERYRTYSRVLLALALSCAALTLVMGGRSVISLDWDTAIDRSFVIGELIKLVPLFALTLALLIGGLVFAHLCRQAARQQDQAAAEWQRRQQLRQSRRAAQQQPQLKPAAAQFEHLTATAAGAPQAAAPGSAEAAAQPSRAQSSGVSPSGPQISRKASR